MFFVAFFGDGGLHAENFEMEPENISLEKEVNIDPNHQVLGSSRQFPKRDWQTSGFEG